MDAETKNAIDAAKYLAVCCSDIIPFFMDEFDSAKASDFKELLNRITPTLISVRNDLEFFVQLKNDETEKRIESQLEFLD